MVATQYLIFKNNTCILDCNLPCEQTFLGVFALLLYIGAIFQLHHDAIYFCMPNMFRFIGSTQRFYHCFGFISPNNTDKQLILKLHLKIQCQACAQLYCMNADLLKWDLIISHYHYLHFTFVTWKNVIVLYFPKYHPL